MVAKTFGPRPVEDDIIIEVNPTFEIRRGNPHKGGKQDDPAANDPRARDEAIRKLSDDLERGTDKKTGKPYSQKDIQRKKRRLKLLEKGITA